MMKPQITVYIASHNYGKYLTDAIESVLRQSRTDWELLLINDNSTDDTQSIMETYASDARVRIFKTQGIGLPAVCNLALKYAHGKYLIRLDGDDVFDENILLVLANMLDRNVDTALVFPDYFLMDEAGHIFAQERRQPINSSNHLLDMPANGACTMIRKDVLEKMGGYREDLGAQDGFDLWTKTIKQFKCSNVNVPLFYYRRHGENLTESTQRIVQARQAIKRDASSLDLDRFKPITAVIPCRRNYDCCPDLWNQKIGNKSLLELAISKCVASKIFQNIIVTSDNPEALKTLDQFKDPRLSFLERSSDLTIRSRTIAETLSYVNQTKNLGSHGLTTLLAIQAPFVTTETLEESVHTLIMNDADSAITVEAIHKQLFKRTPHGLTPINYLGTIASDFDVIYANTRACVTTKNSNLKHGSLTGSKVVHFVTPENEKFYISTRRDLEIGNQLLGKSS